MMCKSDAAPSAPISEELEEDRRDSNYGMLMFFGFFASVWSVTLAICVLAMAPSWWVLGVVVAVHIGVTSATTRMVYAAFSSPAYPDLERVEGPSRAVLSGTIGDVNAHAVGRPTARSAASSEILI